MYPIFVVILFSNNILAEDIKIPDIKTIDNNLPYILTEDEKKSLRNLRELLTKQPEHLREEILSYRSFVANLRKEKHDYDNKLSQEAKNFLQEELKLRNALSINALNEYYKKELLH